MVAFNNVLSASFTLFLASLQVAAQVSDPTQIGGNAPMDCKDACTIALNSQHNCRESVPPDQLLSCACSDTNAQAIATCYSCVIGLKGSPMTLQDTQNNVNEFVNTCKAAGASVDAVTVTAGNTSGNGAVASVLVDVAATAVAGICVIYALL